MGYVLRTKRPAHLSLRHSRSRPMDPRLSTSWCERAQDHWETPWERQSQKQKAKEKAKAKPEAKAKANAKTKKQRQKQREKQKQRQKQRQKRKVIIRATYKLWTSKRPREFGFLHQSRASPSGRLRTICSQQL